MLILMTVFMFMMLRVTFLCSQALGPTMRPVGPCWLPWPEPLPERAIVKIGTTATIINIIVIIIIINIIILMTDLPRGVRQCVRSSNHDNAHNARHGKVGPLSR